jgi:hypothetical protein
MHRICFFLLSLSLLPICCSAQHDSQSTICMGGSTLPAEARKIIQAQFNSWRIVTVADLQSDEQQLWKTKFGDQCPGIVAGRFNPNPKPSYALTLIKTRGQNSYQTLVVLTGIGRAYRAVTLSRSHKTTVISVITKVPAAKYSDAENLVHVHTKFDSILYEAIENGAILYYWARSGYRSLQTSE